MTSRNRNWCFTHNNFTLEVIAKLKLVECKYMVWGEEVGESGTPHLQGLVCFASAKTLSATKGLIGATAHLEIMRGSFEQAATYCKKDNTNVVEIGTLPLDPKRKGEVEKERWDNTKKLAKEGRLDDIDSDLFIRYYRTLKDVKKDYMTLPADMEKPCGMWYWGESGNGKSFLARKEFPGAYKKMANKWWDGYQNEEFVILDDLDLKHDCLGHHLKIWADQYSFVAETKGGAISIRPKTFVVTSQYHPTAIWTDKETLTAISRRFEIVYVEKHQ